MATAAQSAPAAGKAPRGRFREDVARYRSKGYSGHRLWLEPALWAIGTHRLGNWLFAEPPAAPVRIPLKAAWFFLNKLCQIVMEMDIDAQATIGGGLYIGHIGGVHINPGAIMGRNCDLAHRITIGASAMGRSGIPVLGDEVYIGTGAALVGRIKIGSGAKIAANSLVITNVPAGATVMGVPARIIMQAPKPVAAKAEAVLSGADLPAVLPTASSGEPMGQGSAAAGALQADSGAETTNVPLPSAPGALAESSKVERIEAGSVRA